MGASVFGLGDIYQRYKPFVLQHRGSSLTWRFPQQVNDEPYYTQTLLRLKCLNGVMLFLVCQAGVHGQRGY